MRKASVMPYASHSSYEACPTPIPRAHFPTATAARSRSGLVSSFESRMPRRCASPATTAPTVTGPAHAPRPTSSIPTTTCSPAAQHRRSRRSVGIGTGRTVSSGLPGSVDLALPILPVRRAQAELLELPRGGARQLVAELHARGALVVREVLAAVVDQVVFGGFGSWCEHDQRLDRLTPLLVGHPDDGDLGDGG